MTIETLAWLDNCVLSVYRCADKTYRFSIVNPIGEAFTCRSSFPNLSSARFMARYTVRKLAIKDGKK